MNDIDKRTDAIRANYLQIKEQIRKAATRKGIDPSSVGVIGVTKSHPPEVIDAGIRAGVKIIGENKVQEAEEKFPLLRESYEEFHYIGHLQKNKINKLLRLNPVLIHSIDKFSTAKKLNDSLEMLDRQQEILIQVNTSGEESKFGIPADYSKVRDFVRHIGSLKRLRIRGLMTIGKFTDNEREVRDCFSLLRFFFESLKREDITGVRMEVLSMGMTNDYPIAVEEGANLLRIGTALFGSRNLASEKGGD